MPALNIPIEVLIYAQLPRILRGEEVDLTPIIDAMVSEKIIEAIRASMPVPTEFEPVIDVMLMAENLRTITAALRGETYEPKLDRVIELLVTFSIVEHLTSAFTTGS